MPPNDPYPVACDPWLEPLSAKVDGELADASRRALDAHLADCAGCRATEREFERLRRRMRLHLVDAPEGGPGLDLATTAVGPTIDIDQVLTLAGGASADRRLARRAAVACVAALLVLVGVAVGLRRGGTTAPLPGADEVEVVQARDGSFDKSSLTVSTGATVAWANTGGVSHHLVHDLPDATVATDLAPGETDDVTFSQAGVYEYRCTIHPDMHGEIVVES